MGKKPQINQTENIFLTQDVTMDSSIVEISYVHCADGHLTVNFRASHAIKSSSGSR